MISIIIPLYNKEKEVLNTLKSVLGQAFQGFEIVIVNDGSTDHSVEVVAQVKDDRIRLIHQENQGVSVARNRGINEAKYDYIALLDADDEWKPEYLETQVKLIENFPDCKVFACRYEFRDSQGITTPIILNKIPFKGSQGLLDNYFVVSHCSTPPICSINIVVEKEAFLSIGGFPLYVKHGEDLLTWARLATRFQIAYSMIPLAVYNLKASSGNYEIPINIPQEDSVGEQLIALLQQTHQKGLRKYIGFWYKIRANLFLRADEKRNFLRCFFKSLKYYPLNYKLWGYLFILLIPLNFRNSFFRSVKSLISKK